MFPPISEKRAVILPEREGPIVERFASALSSIIIWFSNFVRGWEKIYKTGNLAHTNAEPFRRWPWRDSTLQGSGIELGDADTHAIAFGARLYRLVEYLN